MNALKRLCISVNASINTLIDQVENHEAVADAALADIHDALANARFQLRRIQGEQKRLQDRIGQCRDEEILWRDRAVRIETRDRECAIECVRRMKKVQQEISSLSSQAAEHGTLEKQLGADVKNIEARFEELKRRRSALAARESRAEAFQSVRRQQSGGQIDGAFERWERAVLRSESSFESEPVDNLADQLSSEEEKHELEALLNELVIPAKNS